MKFQCRHTYEDNHEEAWEGSWELVCYDGPFWEVMIEARGSSFHSIIGYSSVGLYICIPSLDIGCGLSNWSDIFWNTEKLSGFLPVTDAVTIAEGLRSFSQK